MTSEERSPVSARNLLLIFFVLAMLLRIAVVMHSPSQYHPDEIFQNTEPAHRLAFGPSVISWEWRLGIRSWVFPAFLAAVMRATSWMGPGSTGYLAGIAAVMSLISLTVVWFGFSWCERASGRTAAIIAGIGCATWWEFVYFGPKTFSEVLAAHVLLPGLYLGVYGEKIPWKRRLFFAGMFCGLALALRIQLAPAAGLAALYFCRNDWRRRIPVVAAGMLTPILIFGLVDAITWQHLFQSFYLYFYVNLIQGRSASFGVEPWYWYLPRLARHLGPLLLLALVGVRRSPFLGWMALVILAAHSLVHHKEARFLYPMMPIMVTLGALGMVECAAIVEKWRGKTISPRILVATGIIVCLGSSIVLGSRFEDWSRYSGGLQALKEFSHDSTVCGVGISDIFWAETGGYTYLHRDVPIFLLPDSEALRRASAEFNVFMSNGSLAEKPAGFEAMGCRSGNCVYRRPGTCAAPGEFEINRTLVRKDQ